MAIKEIEIPTDIIEQYRVWLAIAAEIYQKYHHELDCVRAMSYLNGWSSAVADARTAAWLALADHLGDAQLLSVHYRQIADVLDKIEREEARGE